MVLLPQLVLLISLARAFNLPTRAFNLPAHAFNLATLAFSLLTLGSELFVTHGFELATRGFELVTHRFELVTRISELVTRNPCFTFPRVFLCLHFKHKNNDIKKKRFWVQQIFMERHSK